MRLFNPPSASQMPQQASDDATIVKKWQDLLKVIIVSCMRMYTSGILHYVYCILDTIYSIPYTYCTDRTVHL